MATFRSYDSGGNPLPEDWKIQGAKWEGDNKPYVFTIAFHGERAKYDLLFTSAEFRALAGLIARPVAPAGLKLQWRDGEPVFVPDED